MAHEKGGAKQRPNSAFQNLPQTGFLRLSAILAPNGPIPVGRSTWWAGVKEGRYPKPIKLGARISEYSGAAVKHWGGKPIGEVCAIVNGGTPKTDVAEYWAGNHLWIAPAEMGGRKVPYVDATKRTLTDEGLANSSAKLLPEYSVILSSRAPIGHLVINTKPMAFNQGCKGLIPSSRLNYKYLYYYLYANFDLLNDLGTGTTFKELSGGKLKEATIPLPTILEQLRIVGILDEAFAGLEAMRANAGKNLQNARALFDTELEDIFTNTLAHAPRKTLAEIALEIGRGKSRHRPRGDPKLLGGRYPFIQTGEVANAIHVIESYSQTYNELGLAQSKLWPKNTVCIAIVGANVAETAILGFDACFPDSVIGFIANPKHADVDYVQYLLRSFKSVLKEKGKGTARDNINMGTFESERFPMPSVSEQSSIALRLTSLSGETQLLEDVYLRKLAAIDELKKSLLHNAFSGNL